MLGAQARAAEYNAAKNASARQASREAEEQKLPPKPTPLSLSVFSKNPPVNRNKGTKKYSPLVLSDDGKDEEVVQDGDSPNNTPTKLPGEGTEIKVGADSTNSTDRPRVRMPFGVPVPTAPRAMRPAADPFSLLTPQKMQQYATSIGNPLTVSAAQYGASSNVFPTGAYSHSRAAHVRGLPLLDPLGHPIGITPEGMQRYGPTIIPANITPTKQEQKIFMMSQGHPNSFTGMIEPMLPVMEQPFAYNPMQMHCPYIDAMTLSPAWERSQLHTFTNAHLFRRPTLQQPQSDITPLATSTVVRPVPTNILMRHQSSVEEQASHVPPARPSIQRSGGEISTSNFKENDEPYDRTSKMQKFVAAQQAFAKTGKTVLNNPSLQKTTEEEMTKIIDEALSRKKSVFLAKQETPAEVEPNFALHNALPVPPGFEDVNSNSMSEYSDEEESVGISADDAVLRECFRVEAEEWLELKPVSRGDREKMAAAMQHVAAKMSENLSQPLHIWPDLRKAEHLHRWFHSDSRGWQVARERVHQAAATYCAHLRDNDKSSTSAEVDANMQAGLIRGAGNMLANLTQYIFDDKSEDAVPDYFSRTKPPPEFAIERVGGLGANIGGTSFFEDDRGGFYNAPTRIARDPRFRPQSKEGGEVKAEDEWTHRHEMYGRRRL